MTPPVNQKLIHEVDTFLESFKGGVQGSTYEKEGKGS